MSAEQNQPLPPVVLITGARAPVALEQCRHFAKRGWRVIAADSVAWPLARFSNCVARFYRLPPPRQSQAAFAAAILEIAQKEKPRWIVPTCEEVFYLGKLHSQLPDGVRLLAPEAAQLASLHHKADFLTLVSGCPVEVPPSRVLTAHDTAEALFQSWPELVLKPVYSRFASRTRVRPTLDEARRVLAEREEQWLAQQFIAGEEFCSYSVLREGRVLAHACYRPLLRAGLGAGVYFEPQDAPDVQAFVAAFAAKHQLTGQVGFDFIRTPEGRLYVLECNPRATSGAHLFEAGDLVHAIADGGEVTASRRPAMIGLACVLFAGGQLLRLPQPWRVLCQACDAVWSRPDPWPFLLQGLGLAETAWVALRKGIGLRAATTDDIEWNGEA